MGLGRRPTVVGVDMAARLKVWEGTDASNSEDGDDIEHSRGYALEIHYMYTFVARLTFPQRRWHEDCCGGVSGRRSHL